MTQSIKRACERRACIANRREARINRRCSAAAVPVCRRRSINIVGQGIRFAQHPGTAHALHTIDVRQLIRRCRTAITAQGADKGSARNVKVTCAKSWQHTGHLTPGACAQIEARRTDHTTDTDIAASTEIDNATRQWPQHGQRTSGTLQSQIRPASVDTGVVNRQVTARNEAHRCIRCQTGRAQLGSARVIDVGPRRPARTNRTGRGTSAVAH